MENSDNIVTYRDLVEKNTLSNYFKQTQKQNRQIHRDHENEREDYDNTYSAKKTNKNIIHSNQEKTKHVDTRKDNKVAEAHQTMFKVEFGNRNEHPEANKIPLEGCCIMVNGYPGPNINLKYGITYVFQIDQEDTKFEFVFTEDEAGGPAGRQIYGTPSATKGLICLKITKDLPNKFYYGVKNALYCGGMIVIKYT